MSACFVCIVAQCVCVCCAEFALCVCVCVCVRARSTMYLQVLKSDPRLCFVPGLVPGFTLCVCVYEDKSENS